MVVTRQSSSLSSLYLCTEMPHVWGEATSVMNMEQKKQTAKGQATRKNIAISTGSRVRCLWGRNTDLEGDVLVVSGESVRVNFFQQAGVKCVLLASLIAIQKPRTSLVVLPLPSSSPNFSTSPRSILRVPNRSTDKCDSSPLGTQQKRVTFEVDLNAASQSHDFYSPRTVQDLNRSFHFKRHHGGAKTMDNRTSCKTGKENDFKSGKEKQSRNSTDDTEGSICVGTRIHCFVGTYKGLAGTVFNLHDKMVTVDFDGVGPRRIMRTSLTSPVSMRNW